jgi:pilus assembly protein CpaF
MDYLLTLAIPGQPVRQTSLPEGTYSIGRNANCVISLSDPSVSDLHANLILTNEGAWVEDLQSSNGTFVNARPIAARTLLTAGAIITIGGAVFRVQPRAPKATPEVAPKHPTEGKSQRDIALPTVAAHAPATQAHTLSPAERARHERHRQVKSQLHAELIKRLGLKRLATQAISSEELENRVKSTLKTILDELQQRDAIPAEFSTQQLMDEIYDEAVRLGPIEKFLADDSITEVMVNGPHNVYVERNGKLELSEQTFMDDDSVMAVIERIVAPLGRRIDESQPYVDARLADGSRVNAIIPPLSLIGPCITIRKFAKRVLTEQDFVNFGTWTPAIAGFLRVCVQLRKNIIVAGGTGSGKTTLLNVLSSFIPSRDRILTIEDAAELRLNQPHVVRLEARPANIEGKGAITIRDLVRNALRMRPDRIIVGECRGGESLDMLQAMNTGHDGSLTTVHANSPRDVISRLETMVLMSGVDLPSRAIREQIASAVNIIVQEARLTDGSRRIVAVTEITGMEGQQIVMQDLFVFKQTGIDAKGRVLGYLTATGAMPSFYDTLTSRGIELDPSLFSPREQA